MPLVPHKITNYTDELRNQITEGEGFESKVYYNDGDTPTIGYGLALYDKTLGTKVSTAFSDIEKAGITISAEDKILFEQIETAMQATPRNNTTIRNLVDQLTLDLGDEATGQAVFSHTIGRYEAAVKNKIGDTLYTKLEDSKELIALVDVAYNGGAGLLGPGLRHALAHENRAEAWFQIRYNSNGGQSRIDYGKGIANRRVAESDVFGLYDETPSAEGMKDIIRMARLHATEISTEESAFPVTTSSSSPNPYAGDNGIEHQIQAAKDYLITEFGKDVKIDGKVIVGNNSINDNSANRGRTNINDIHLNGSSNNDLIFGENGDDTLRGKAGDDVLYGGEGKDKLYGGRGNDIYIAGAGDTIKDTDNQGKVYFDATLLSGIKHKVRDNVYEDAMFTYTKEANTLHIAQKADPSKSITIEHWNSQTNQALGIVLSDERVEEDKLDSSRATILPTDIATPNQNIAAFTDTQTNSKSTREETPQDHYSAYENNLPDSVNDYLSQFGSQGNMNTHSNGYEETNTFSPQVQEYLDQFAQQREQGYENNNSYGYDGYGD